jgi:hypothetical protein
MIRPIIFVVSVDGKEVLEARDASYPRGSVGLRVVDTHACFSDLKITSAGTSLRPGRSDG